MADQPNIIFILTDHFRRDALGPATPNLNRLAQEGVRFEHAYCASPLCQPSRTAIAAGMHPGNTGVCGNQSEPLPMHLRGETLMCRLQDAGYHTALVGKHHYIDRYGVGMDVTADDEALKGFGFEEMLQVIDDGENGHNRDRYTAYLEERGKLEAFLKALNARPRSMKHPFEADDTADGFIGVHAINFVKEYSREQPFYLHLGFVGPHPPYWSVGDLPIDPMHVTPPLEGADTPEIREIRAHYHAKCALIDSYVGRLATTLKARGLDDNTVIVFTSDHGDCLGDFGILDKRHFYECSAGVPLLMHGPGVPINDRGNGPRVSKMLVSHLDLYPTLLGLAGAQVPRDVRRPGRDLVAMLNGHVAGHDAIFAELATAVMVRTANWKMVYDPQQGGVQQLFNLAVDPQELFNLAGAPGYEHVVRDLLERMLAHKICQNQATHVKEAQRLQRVNIPF